jgi:hypothetical protein
MKGKENRSTQQTNNKTEKFKQTNKKVRTNGSTIFGASLIHITPMTAS